MENLIQDLRYNLRSLIRNPGFTLVAVLTLALSIGASTAIFSVVNFLLIRSLPYKDADRLAMIWSTDPEEKTGKSSASLPDMTDWISQSQAFEDVEAFDWANFNLVGAGEPERVPGMRVTAGFFQLLGVTPQAGRAFLAEEDKPESNRVVILSQGYWKRRFGSSEAILGQTIPLNGVSHTVVGIMPADFEASFSNWPDWPNQVPNLWVPFTLDPKRFSDRSARVLYTLGRLKPGVSLSQAQADMSLIAGRLSEQYPDSNEKIGASVVPLQQEVVGKIRPALLVLMGSVGFVLLIACANVATLLLARAAGRQKEIALRLALGASRGRLIKQLLTESLLLAFIGGILGVLVAYLGLRLLVAIGSENIPRVELISIDGQVLGFTLLVIVITGLTFGLLPGLLASKPDINSAIKEGSKNTAGSTFASRARSLLVMLEIAVALPLLIGAGLMIRSFIKLQETQIGFHPDNVLIMRTILSRDRYADDHQIATFYNQVLERVASVPGVQAAGTVVSLPLGASNMKLFFTINGRRPPTTKGWPPVDFNLTSPDYFRAMNTELKSGRYFTGQDSENAPPVVIINESMAQQFWPDEDPLGKQISLDMPGKALNGLTIVGVVADIRQRGLDEKVEPGLFVPYLQLPSFARAMSLVVRSAGDPISLAPAVRGEVWALDKDQPVFDITTMRQLLSKSVASRRFNMVLLEVFAVVAVILALIGVYGLMAYLVAQRLPEVGIRLALGAQRYHVLNLFLGKGLALTLSGMAFGLAVAFAVTRLLTTLLFETSHTDPMIFVLASTLLVAAALLAIYLQARKATRVDPAIALRYE